MTTPTVSCLAIFFFLLLATGAANGGPTSQPTTAPTVFNSRTIANLRAGRAATIVTYGTSLTQGAAWVSGVQKALAGQFGDRVKVVNSGMSGCNSADGLRELNARVLKAKPDMVFIEFAINDCVLRFDISQAAARKNLETMIDRILEAGPQTEIVLMTMNAPVGGEFVGKRTEFLAYYEMYRQVARDRRLPLIDNYVLWKKVLDENPALYKGSWVRDGVHASAEAQLKVTLPAILAALGVAEPADMPAPRPATRRDD